jgi:hypothetical protein
VSAKRSSTNNGMKTRELFFLKKETYEIMKAIQDVKEEITKIWKSQRKIKQKHWKQKPP